MRFLACLHRATVDKEGETTITLKVSKQFLQQSLDLMKMTETLLDVTLKKEGSYEEHPEVS